MAAHYTCDGCDAPLTLPKSYFVGFESQENWIRRQTECQAPMLVQPMGTTYHLCEGCASNMKSMVNPGNWTRRKPSEAD